MYKDVTLMHSLALQDKSQDTIDATIGVLLDDNKNLVFSKYFDNALKQVSSKVYNYAPVDGGALFKQTIADYFKVPSSYTIVASPGATGALTLLMKHKKRSTNALVIPELSWVNYLQMAKLNDYDIVFYDNFSLTFDYGIFNKYDNVVVVINTPASNPIGTTYTKEELDKFTNNFMKYDNATCIFDLAYYSFDSNQEFIFDYGKQFPCYFAVTFSKTLGVYGFRLGALISSQDEKLAPIARGVWSSIGNIGIEALVACLKNVEVNNEIENNKLLLQRRTKYFIELLDEYKIPYYSFQNGFFVTLNFDDPNPVVEYLMKDHIYTINCNHGVRIAVSGLNNDELYKIANKVKEFIQIACI